jgi:glycine cleavage system protein P-like pyridoxal-binding family
MADAPEAFNGVAALGAAGLVVVGGKAIIIKTFQFKRKIKIVTYIHRSQQRHKHQQVVDCNQYRRSNRPSK